MHPWIIHDEDITLVNLACIVLAAGDFSHFFISVYLASDASLPAVWYYSKCCV